MDPAAGATYRRGVDAATLAERLRDEVRVRGIDPMADRDSVRALALEAVASLPGAVADDVARAAVDAVAGFGPLQRYLDDPEVEELWLNAPGRVFVARRGVSELTTVVLDEDEVRALIERMLRLSGRRLDLSSPFVDAVLVDGSRLHVAIPDITRRHWAINIRRHVVRARSVFDLVDLGVVSSQAARFLDAAVRCGLNILVAGGTQSGKTTFLNALLGSVDGRERIISCEEVFELRLEHPDWVGLQTRPASLEGVGEVPLRRLVVEALRMRPTRLVVGEVRQGEALDLLVAMNSGMPAMATIHANGAREAVTKLCTLPLMAGPNIDAAFVVPTVASSLDLVVHLESGPGGRRVREIAAVSGRVESGVVEISHVFESRAGLLVRGTGYPPHQDRFAAHGVDVRSMLGEASG